MVKYSIVTAYYQKEEMTVDFLNNLVDKLPRDSEVILVNAGSKPIEHPIVTKRVDLPVNKSFSNSMNAGMLQATGDYVIVIGNDVFPQTRDWLHKLAELQEKTEAWIVAPSTDNPPMSVYKQYILREYPTYSTYHMFPAICWMIPRPTIQEIGYFDERFERGTYEDNDYVVRVLAAGGEIVVSKEVTVHHLLSQTMQLLDVHDAMAKNLIRFKEKWGK
jgi:O-antigen biosynthesis protein